MRRVDRAGEQGVVEGGRVGDVLDGHVLEERLAAPVLVVAGQRDRVAHDPRLDGVGAGADRLVGQVRNAVGRHHGADVGGHPEQPVVARLGEVDLQLGGRERLGGGDDVHGLLQAVGPLGLDVVDGEHRVVGGEGLAVAEGRVVDQVERVGLAVRRERPRLGQAGHVLAAVVELDERLVDVRHHDLGDRRARLGREVVVGGFEDETHLDHVAAGCRRRGGAGARGAGGQPDAKGGKGRDEAREARGHGGLSMGPAGDGRAQRKGKDTPAGTRSVLRRAFVTRTKP